VESSPKKKEIVERGDGDKARHGKWIRLMYGQMFLGSKFGALSIMRWTVRLGPGKARTYRDGVILNTFNCFIGKRECFKHFLRINVQLRDHWLLVTCIDVRHVSKKL